MKELMRHETLCTGRLCVGTARFIEPQNPFSPVLHTLWLFHSQCLEVDTQDTGPAYIRMRLTLARGPLDPLLSQPYSISRRAGPLNA